MSAASVPHVDSLLLRLAGTALFDLANNSPFPHYRRVSEAALGYGVPAFSTGLGWRLPGLIDFRRRTSYYFQVLAADFSGTSSWKVNNVPSGFFASTTIAHLVV